MCRNPLALRERVGGEGSESPLCGRGRFTSADDFQNCPNEQRSHRGTKEKTPLGLFGVPELSFLEGNGRMFLFLRVLFPWDLCVFHGRGLCLCPFVAPDLFVMVCYSRRGHKLRFSTSPWPSGGWLGEGMMGISGADHPMFSLALIGLDHRSGRFLIPPLPPWERAGVREQTMRPER